MKMAAGSWIRFVVGLLLAIEALRLWFIGGSSIVAVLLAIVYVILAITFFIFRF
jgi:hypothetical protein